MEKQGKPYSIMAEENCSSMQTPCAAGSGMEAQRGSLIF
jgi:hypothetical protein